MGDNNLPEPTDPAAEGPQDPGSEGAETPAEPTGIAAALAKARETLQAKGTMVPDDEPGDEPEVDDEPEEEGEPDDEPDDEPEEEEEEESDELPDEEDDDEPEVDDEPEEEEEPEEEPGEEEEEEEEEEPEKKTFTGRIPGRHPGDDDIEIEVEDEALAEHINALRNGFMRRQQFEAALEEIQGAQEELATIEEQFMLDPAGFVLDNLEEDTGPNVALALLTEPEIWKSLQPTIEKLLDDPKELRTLQAEAKASRLETKERLKEAAAIRKQQTENAREITKAIDLMVPEELGESRREALIKDLTRDIKEHIERNKLQKLDAKDLPTIVANRLELNGIDPLEARKAIKNGKRSQGKPSTKKRPRKKPKSGKQLRRASAKRKKVAAAPGPGKKAAPTEPKKLPAGQTIQERIAAVRKSGGLGTFLGDR